MTDVVPYTPHDSIEIADDSFRLAQRVAGTEFVPKGLRGKPEAVLACILTGHEMGIGPMEALAKIHVVDGRPSMAAELMRAQIMRAGHEIYIEDSTNTRVTVTGIRAGTGRTLSITWSVDDARTAGLLSKDNWKKYPRAMLTARATSEVARGLFPDCLGGMAYTPEEISDLGEGEEAQDDATPTKKKAPAKKRTRKTTAVAKKKAAAPSPAETTSSTERARPPLPGEDDDEIVDAEIVGDEDEAEAGSGEQPEADSSSPTPTDDDNPDAISDAQHRKLMALMTKAGFDDDDRHAVCEELSGGRTTSSKGLTKAEASTLIEELQAEEEPSESSEEEYPDPMKLGGVGWKRELKRAGVRMAELIRYLQSIEDEIGEKAPGSIAVLMDSPETVQVLALEWLRDQGADE